MAKYIVEEDVLLSLIEDSFTLTALDLGGVDNWSWYGDALRDYLKTLIEENGIPYSSNEDGDYSDDIWSVGYEGLAKYFLEHGLEPGVIKLED